MDDYKGCDDCGKKGEYSDISLRLNMGSDYVEVPLMEVEEVLHGDSQPDSDAQSVISENDEPPALMRQSRALSRRSHLGTSKPASTKHLEAASFQERTPFTRAHSPGTLAPVPKPRRGRKEAIPVPTPETGKVAGAPTVAGPQRLPPPKSARGDSLQVISGHSELIECDRGYWKCSEFNFGLVFWLRECDFRGGDRAIDPGHRGLREDEKPVIPNKDKGQCGQR
ncbi:hypothetical protein P4O66_023065 [Electrophorus voltai]|uniref:Uncharacterized protein n=1 Tax=Electrophorus voltai TaxID=2609070 RepID=A0AAD8ZL69_9TELE|nr:hypothetical protein P4O66_023065 [Electrophorus voltai]